MRFLVLCIVYMGDQDYMNGVFDTSIITLPVDLQYFQVKSTSFRFVALWCKGKLHNVLDVCNTKKRDHATVTIVAQININYIMNIEHGM